MFWVALELRADYNRGAFRPFTPEERDMRLARPLIASLVILGLSTSGFAGDLQDSVARAAQQQTQTSGPSKKMDKSYLITGGTVFVVGMSMAVWGFLHTNGGEFVSGEVSKEANTALGATGLAVAGAGGAILFLGSQRAKKAPSLTFGPKGFKVSKQLTW
jgi:hypothetical protein